MNPASPAVLAYHSIDDSGSVISTSRELFRLHMHLLAEARTPIVPLDRVRTSPGAIAITFDDGFRNFISGALPALLHYRFPATVFVVSDYCGRRNDWPSQPSGIPVLDLMDWDELREIAREGISLGGHSATHPRLATLSDADVEREIAASRATIEDRAEVRPTAFAYPYGISDARVRRCVARDYSIACGTALRFLDTGDDPLDLPRIDAFYLRNEWTMRNLLGPAGRTYIRARGLMRVAWAAVAGNGYGSVTRKNWSRR